MNRTVDELFNALKLEGYEREHLPNDRNDLSWNELKGEPLKLTIQELSRLKNYLFPIPPPATVPGMFDRTLLCDVVRIKVVWKFDP